MKRPAGWQLLACVAVALALYLALSRLRVVRPPGGQEDSGPPGPREWGNAAPRRPPLESIFAPPPPWEGPLVQIDPDELARAGRRRDDNGLKMAFCWCPPGTFGMGTDPPRGGERPGSPPRIGFVRVTLSRGYWMGKFEVTQDQWQKVTGLTQRQQRAKDPSQPRGLGDGSMREHAGEGPDYPIYFTSHRDAEEFCGKLTESERAAGRLEPGWEYRLPTDAQWEYACRAGTTTATAFGDLLSSNRANFDGTQPHRGAPVGRYLRNTTPVGSYPANAWGIYDMHGNVSEWCRDGYEPMLFGGTNPIVKTHSPKRSFRGGCWYDGAYFCESTTRFGGKVEGRGSGRGFRVALVPVDD